MTTDIRRSTGLFLLIASVLGAALLYSVATTPVDPAFLQYWTTFGPATARIDGGRMTLRAGKRVKIGRSVLVFRGLVGDSIRLDHYLLDSNPYYAYPYQIPVSQARVIFRIGRQRFRVLSFDADAIKIQLVREPAAGR